MFYFFSIPNIFFFSWLKKLFLEKWFHCIGCGNVNFFDIRLYIRFNCRFNWATLGFEWLADRRDERTVSLNMFISIRTRRLPSIFISIRIFDCFISFPLFWTLSLQIYLIKNRKKNKNICVEKSNYQSGALFKLFYQFHLILSFIGYFNSIIQFDW